MVTLRSDSVFSSQFSVPGFSLITHHWLLSFDFGRWTLDWFYLTHHSLELSAVSFQLAIPCSTNRPISYSTASPNEPNELNEPYEPLFPFNHSTNQLFNSPFLGSRVCFQLNELNELNKLITHHRFLSLDSRLTTADCLFAHHRFLAYGPGSVVLRR